MKAFVTGGTGFIGSQVVRRLLERGHDVTCLVRSPAKAAGLSEMGAAVVQGDITDRESMREGMTGADVVFHIAAWYEVGLLPSDEERMEQINVGGTENVLGLAVEMGIPKIVYTSTVAVLGDTYGRVVDETYKRGSAFDSAYDRTKYQAHQMAERYIAQGAPIVVVMPAAVYGPGDHSVIGEFLRLQLRGLLPAVFGADTGFTFVHVEDVAEGHVLAAEKGEIGQAYVLAGDVMTGGDAFQLTARLAGIAAPLVQLNSRWVAPLVPLVEWLERFVALPLLFSSETLRSAGRTWWVTSAKAERGLGYTHRSVEEGMAETVLWEAERLRAERGPMQVWIVLVLVAVVGLLGLGLLLRRRKNIQ